MLPESLQRPNLSKQDLDKAAARLGALSAILLGVISYLKRRGLHFDSNLVSHVIEPDDTNVVSRLHWSCEECESRHLSMPEYLEAPGRLRRTNPALREYFDEGNFDLRQLAHSQAREAVLVHARRTTLVELI